jgi:hypothetical protein
MAALFAYVFSIAVFLGGGYAGLYVLSHPDEFHQPAKPGKVVKREARHAPKPIVASATAVAKSAHEPPPTEPAKQSASAEKQTVAGEAEKQTAVANANTPDVSTPDVNTPNADQTVATVASPAAEIAAENTSPAESSTIISSSASDAVPVVAADKAPGVAESKSLAVVREANAEEKEVPSAPLGKTDIKTDIRSDIGVPLPNENAVPARKPASGSGAKTEKMDKPALHRAARRTQRTHTARAQRKLVKMVMRTIEFPDGHREVRLISPDRARSAAAYESESDDLF